MNYLDDYNINTNQLFMGDFNIYTSSEPAYQLLLNYTNPELNFYDPINTPGSWNNNSYYSNVHSQSTHSGQNDCAASGGMDDRFDFVLISDNIKHGSNSVKYVDGSYTTIGQDGEHFNQSINAPPTNLSAPLNVIDALYGNSDHLPISIKLSIDKTLGVHEHTLFSEISTNNPVAEVLELNIRSSVVTDVKIEIMNISGVAVFIDKRKITAGQNKIEYNLRQLSGGIYFAVFTSSENERIVKKIVKK
jgi:hypothetical protein